MKSNIRWMKNAGLLSVLGMLGPLVAGCGSKSNTAALSGPPIYVLSISSLANLHETITSISPADTEGVTSGTTGLNLYYKPGATVTVTAQASDNSSGAFLGWCDVSSGNSSPFNCVAPPCTSVSGLSCTVTMNSNLNLLATYPGVTGVTITPITSTVVVPSTTQFTVTVNGLGTYVDGNGQTQNYQNSPYGFTLTGPAAYIGSPGTISSSGLYTTPYPAPASVTVKAFSTVFPTAVDLAQLTLTLPAPGAGPALTVDAGSPTHTISPNIYGINDYQLDPSIPAAINLPIERWGGDSATRYNYLVDATNSASDYYFETNFPPPPPMGPTYPVVSQFNSQVIRDEKTNTSTLATVPLIGFTTQRIAGACSYSVAKYGAQTVNSILNNKDCGNGHTRYTRKRQYDCEE